MKYIGYYFAVYAVVLLLFGSEDFLPTTVYALLLVGVGLLLEEI